MLKDSFYVSSKIAKERNKQNVEQQRLVCLCNRRISEKSSRHSYKNMSEINTKTNIEKFHMSGPYIRKIRTFIQLYFSGSSYCHCNRKARVMLCPGFKAQYPLHATYAVQKDTRFDRGKVNKVIQRSCSLLRGRGFAYHILTECGVGFSMVLLNTKG